ncbi:MAG: hypothetical protein RJA83_1174 [Pseudomonadota bacterium]|jgi:hypothetical protein
MPELRKKVVEHYTSFIGKISEATYAYCNFNILPTKSISTSPEAANTSLLTTDTCRSSTPSK